MPTNKHTYYADPMAPPGQERPRLSDGTLLRHDRPLPLLRPEEEAELPRSFDFHCKIFDLLKPAELQAYESVMDAIVNREARQVGPERIECDPQRDSWRILLRWVEIKADVPAALRQRLGG